MTKKIDLDRFDLILHKGENTDNLRPTLYDFLMNRAVDYFANERSHLTEPAFKFDLKDSKALGTAQEFVKLTFDTKDKESFKYQTLLLFQDLLTTHLDDKDPAALIDADLKRLKFVYDNIILENKEALYENVLAKLAEKYLNQPVYAEILFKIASLYMERGNKYKANPENIGKLDWMKAYGFCQQAISKFPNSIGASYCKNLQAQLLRKELQLNAELVNLPNQAILTSIGYRNIEKAFLRVVAVDQEDFEKNRGRSNRNVVDWLLRQKTLQQQVFELPKEGDYRSHRTEVGLKPLTFGYYAVLISDNASFDFKNEGAVAYSMIRVSNLANWARTNGIEQPEMIVVNRTTGAPLAKIMAEIYKRTYNASSRKYNYFKKGTIISDEEGKLRLPAQDREPYRVKLINGADVLYLDDNYSNYYHRGVGPAQNHTHFFLDRGIYRPGQTIYFKGIVIQKSPNGLPSIQANMPVTVTFKDVNNKKVTELNLTTNEFGTINGSFKAPSTGLLGNMSIISTAGGNKYFRVEEYKRPKFEVTFEPIRGSFKLGDDINVEGVAKAFAGNNIDNATLKYRVVRQVRFPYRPYWWHRYNPYQKPGMEIANGELKTDANGKFTIPFKAIADASIPAEKKPQFNYEIMVDVTDITGETRSGQTQVAVGYIALKADIAIPKQIDKNKAFTLNITAENLAGEPEAAVVNVQVFPLATPNKVFKKRFWNQPDVHTLSENAFKTQFPDYAFGDENEVSAWKKGTVLYKQRIDTRLRRLWYLPLKDWKPGKYMVLMETTDKYGQKIEVQKYFDLYDLTTKDLAINTPIWINHPNKAMEPGEQAEICIGSKIDEIYALIEVEKKSKLVRREWKKIRGKEDLTFDVKEEDRGNFHYHITFTANNRTYKQSKTILVPWSNKELTVEYASFRDKLKPGQNEEWQIKIAGPKREKVMAEMVATLYDASLDQFAKNNWNLNLYPTDAYPRLGWNVRGFGLVNSRLMALKWQPDYVKTAIKRYESLNWFDFPFYGRPVYLSRSASPRHLSAPAASPRIMNKQASSREMKAMGGAERDMSLESVSFTDQSLDDENGVMMEIEEEAINEINSSKTDLSGVKVRTNLNETVFFMPNLKTDAEGNVIIKFTMNEALTRWKFLGLATTKDLKIATTTKEIVTQKELMVQPNAPRFVREGDQIEFTAKVSNLTKEAKTGMAQLELFNALTMEPVNLALGLTKNQLPFTAEAGQSAALSWKLTIPKGEVLALTHRVVAKAGDFSDGEESTLPVLTNRMLVTETKPLALRGKETKKFTLQSLKNALHSTTLTPHQYTLEFTSNPAWYAVQALPYLMEYPYDCTEQIFSRYYANTLASSVANAHPKIKTIFDQWKGTDAMKSNLSKNQELKSALLEETPWVLAAESEAAQKKNIGLLFDLNKMADEQSIALAKIQERQLSNGGFSWFPGGRDSWYITQYLAEGMGHLRKLGAIDIAVESPIFNMLERAIAYTDDRVVEHYNELAKNVEKGYAKFENDNLNNLIIHYLYTRSFFPEIQRTAASNKAYDYYVGQAEQFWLNKGIYQEGMIGLALNRMGKTRVSQDILKSLKERALQNEELGMYWKHNSGYHWYQLPMESHALMIEYFQEIANDQEAVNELKIWLLKNKQTNHWKTTKATSAVVYALLMSGENWLMESQPVKISIGKDKTYKAQIEKAQETVEAGSGYFKTSWEGELISSKMADIKVKNPNKQPAWGAVYWQYFEDLDKIKTFKETPLTIDKKLFLEVPSAQGPKMKPIGENATLSPGDKIKVRIEIRVDRSMEYVHLKDTRASGFEPINVLSGYKWQGGLGYYESTGDVATNFFIDYLPKGTYVFEYPLRVAHKGDFSNGITSMQCMYAPEFSSHSEGIRVKVQ
jgi:uncharacterized protein YfaS (alpha-2-macroglobulin family)